MGAPPAHDGDRAVARASASTVGSLFRAAARLHPARIAIEGSDGRTLTYGALAERVARLACVLARTGVTRGERIAVLSENRAEYLEIFLGAATVGAIVACQNWRLAPGELAGCLALVEPAAVFVSPRHSAALAAAAPSVPGLPAPIVMDGADYERRLAATATAAAETGAAADLMAPTAEDPLLILYTSGTTGAPKGAVISHRAEIARNLVIMAEYGISPGDAFAAWSPLYHMGAVDWSLGTLMTGGKVIVIDGFDAARLAHVVATEPLGWLLLMPGMVGKLADELMARDVRPRGVKLCGVMADLVPPAEIARITTLLGAPYANTFGATETGCPPCSSNRVPIGVAPTRHSLRKEQSPFCEVRLVDADDRDVLEGTPGELCLRGPTLFSGYFRAEAVNAHEFRGGWFHMGDVFVRHADGTLDFVDRVKYLIKSGGENIYPAEIERVLLQDPRVAEAAVVRRPDPRWGEVPVAFVARRDPSLTVEELQRLCRRDLAGYKQPKAIVFIEEREFPRSASGKIQRHQLESARPSTSAPRIGRRRGADDRLAVEEPHMAAPPPQPPTPSTSIATATASDVFVRGKSLCHELIGRVTFTEMLFFQILGRQPTPAQTRIVDACLVTLLEHGLTPSALATRLVYGSASEAMQGAVAAGLLAVGSLFVGTTEDCGRHLARILAQSARPDAAATGSAPDPAALAAAAREIAVEHKRARRPVAGFGHPQHKPDDPRSIVLLALARAEGVAGAHVAAVEALGRAVDEVNGRHITLNATGAIAALLGDCGVPAEILRGFAIIARAAGLVGHIHEEQQRPTMRALWESAERVVPYDGATPVAAPTPGDGPASGG